MRTKTKVRVCKKREAIDSGQGQHELLADSPKVHVAILCVFTNVLQFHSTMGYIRARTAKFRVIPYLQTFRLVTVPQTSFACGTPWDRKNF